MAGRIQINTVGNKTLFPYTEPQFSYFSSLFKKHVNFARSNYHIKYDDMFTFGNLTTINIPQNSGDLLNRVILKVTLPKLPNIPGGYDQYGVYSPEHDENIPGFQPVRIYYQESVGHALIEYIDFKIGNQIIERLTGETLQIHSEISDDEGAQVIYSHLINKYPYPNRSLAVSSQSLGTNYNSNAGVSKDLELLINIPFYFSKNPKLYIPICSICRQEISFDIKLRNFEDIIIEYIKPNYEIWTGFEMATIETWGVTKVNNDLQSYLNNIKIKSSEIIFEQTFLDNAERLKLKNSVIDFLMSETQMEEFNMNEEMGKVPERQFSLSFKNPVKELYFVIQRQNIDTTPGVYPNGDPEAIGNQSVVFFGPTTGISIPGSTYVTLFDYDSASDYHPVHTSETGYDPLLPFRPALHAGTFDNLEYLTLTLDGNEIITRETGDYQTLGVTQFNLHHKRTPQTRRFYMHSFALRPDEWEPSGYLNFSNIKDQILDIRLFSSEVPIARVTIPGDPTPGASFRLNQDFYRWFIYPRVLRVYAKSYNILRVKDGIATKLF